MDGPGISGGDKTGLCQVAESGSDRCGCDECGNFALVRDHAYPPEVSVILDSLCIDFTKESEVITVGGLRRDSTLIEVGFMGWVLSNMDLDRKCALIGLVKAFGWRYAKSPITVFPIGKLY